MAPPDTNREEARRISVTVCGSQKEDCVTGLIESLQKSYPQVIANVKYVEIPYNSIDSFRFRDPVDVVILVHSIYNRRMAITNVRDSHFNKFLPMAKSLVGREKLAILVHDMPYPIDRREMDLQMQNFQNQQPLAFQCSGLVITCGKLDGKQPIQIDKEEKAAMKLFLEHTQSLDPPKPPSKLTYILFWLALVALIWLSKVGFPSEESVPPLPDASASDLETEL